MKEIKNNSKISTKNQEEDSARILPEENRNVDAISSPKVSVQCEENTEGQDGKVIFENESYPFNSVITNHILSGDEGVSVYMSKDEDLVVPVQCEDDQWGLHGQVVVEHLSYKMRESMSPQLRMKITWPTTLRRIN
ncbi:hypothetical protein SRHO_G00231140 [Serrasalmus rhombeus]